MFVVEVRFKGFSGVSESLTKKSPAWSKYENNENLAMSLTVRDTRNERLSNVQVDNTESNSPGDGIIRIGDVVYLWADVSSSGCLLTELSGGCLAADGLDQECRVIAHNEMASIPLECLFELRIQHNYKAQRALEQDRLESCDNFDGIPGQRDPRSIQLENDANEEIHRNSYETERSFGMPLVFGQTVQFFHLKSGMYLNLRTADCDGVLDNSEGQSHPVQISAIGSESSWLRIDSRYKIREAGDHVHYWDTVCLATGDSSVDSSLMLSCCSEAVIDAALGATFSLHASTDKYPWKLRLFRSNSIPVQSSYSSESSMSSPVSNKDFVNGGDILRLMHTDIQAYLSFDSANDPSDSVVLSPAQSLPSNDSIDSVESIPVFSLWRLELEDGTSGAVASMKCACRLQHLVTKTYLAFCQQGTSSRFSLVPEPNHTTVFHMEPVFMTEGLLRWQGCVHLQHRVTGVYVHADARAERGPSAAVASSVLLRQDASSVEQVRPAARRPSPPARPPPGPRR